MKMDDLPDFEPFVHYDERTDMEKDLDQFPLPPATEILRQATLFLAKPHPEIELEESFLIDNPRMYEVDIDPNDVEGTANFFGEIRKYEERLKAIPNGLHKPLKGVSIYKDEFFNIRLDFNSEDESTQGKEYSITLKRVPEAEGNNKYNLQVEINEISYTVSRYPHRQELNIRSNLIFFSEVGTTRLFTDITMDNEYIVKRANALQNTAINSIKEVLELMSHSID